MKNAVSIISAVFSGISGTFLLLGAGWGGLLLTEHFIGAQNMNFAILGFLALAMAVGVSRALTRDRQ